MFENSLVCDPVMISATKRVAVYYDHFANDPRRDDDNGVSMFPVEENNRYVTLLPGDDRDVFDAIKDIYSENYWDVDNDEKFEAAVKVFEANNRVWVVKEFTADRDWVGQYLVWTTPDQHTTREFLFDYCKTIQQWINGEVYVVALELLRTYVDQDDPERTFSRWEAEESVGDVYLNSFDDKSILEAAGMSLESVLDV